MSTDFRQMDCRICNGPRRVARDGICCGCATKIADSLLVLDSACVHQGCTGRLLPHETRCLSCLRSQEEDDAIPVLDITKATTLNVLPQLQFVAGYYAGFTFLRKQLTQADVCKFVWMLHKLHLNMRRDANMTNRKPVMRYASLYDSAIRAVGYTTLRSIGDFQLSEEKKHVRKFLHKLWQTFQGTSASVKKTARRENVIYWLGVLNNERVPKYAWNMVALQTRNYMKADIPVQDQTRDQIVAALIAHGILVKKGGQQLVHVEREDTSDDDNGEDHQALKWITTI